MAGRRNTVGQFPNWFRSAVVPADAQRDREHQHHEAENRLCVVTAAELI